MGISQLLPFLARSSEECHISKFKGLTVAVDTYCWLHRGAWSCIMQLAKLKESDMHINYCIKYVRLLLSYNIKPIMVFDGRRLLAKRDTEEKRREARERAQRLGLEAYRLGHFDEARKYFLQAIEITPDMALTLIRECRKLGVDCIVAPYEADAQLAFFNLRKIARCIITEDSDLLLFGCSHVLYKMDQNGTGKLIEADKIHLSMEMKPEKYSFDKFRHMCILSGCDYLDSLPGIGLKTALKFIKLTAETDPRLFLDKIPAYLNKRNLVITPEYKNKFLLADATFKYQVVFDPIRRELVPLNPVPEAEIPYTANAGEFFSNSLAFDIALGNIDVNTLARFANWRPPADISRYSIWSPNFKIRPGMVDLFSTSSEPSSSFAIPPTYIPASNRNMVELGEDEAHDYIINMRERSGQEQIDEDELVDRELAFYMRDRNDIVSQSERQLIVELDLSLGNKPMESPSEDTEDDEDVTAINEDPQPGCSTDPVLGNPFVKKLSKFTKTKKTDIETVVSRFFSQDSSLYSDVMLPVVTSTSQSSTQSDAIHSKGYPSDEEQMPACECVLKIGDGVVVLPEPLQEVQDPALSCVENLQKVQKRRLESEEKQDKVKKRQKQLTINEMFQKMNK